MSTTIKSKDEARSVLGISRDASEKEIRQAYKRKALQYHPDKGGSKEEYLRVNEAYRVLTENPGTLGFSEFNEFSEFQFPGFQDPFHTRFQEQFQQTKPKRTRTESIDLTLEYLCTKKKISINITNRYICRDCMVLETCDACRGTGGGIKQLGPFVINLPFVQCTACDGEGLRVRRNSCTCDSGTIKKIESLSIDINPLITPGQKFVFNNSGSEYGVKNIQRENIVIEIRIVPHQEFTLNEGHLKIKKTISLVDAICGSSFSVIHPSGEHIIGNFNDCIRTPYTEYCIEGKGMNSSKNMYVSFHIDFPQKINEEKREELRESLNTAFSV